MDGCSACVSFSHKRLVEEGGDCPHRADEKTARGGCKMGPRAARTVVMEPGLKPELVLSLDHYNSLVRAEPSHLLTCTTL